MEDHFSDFYYIENDISGDPLIRGPISIEELKKLFHNKIVSEKTTFWDSDQKKWIPFNKFSMFEIVKQSYIIRSEKL